MNSIWFNFPAFAALAALAWVAATGVLYVGPTRYRQALALGLVGLGLAVFATFVGLLWWHLDRPPLRTLGETRLWYSLFLPAIGAVTFWRWRYRWFLGYSVGLSVVFLFINWMHPENYTKVLMPALQSPWFVPHVVVYIFSYALLAASSLVAAKGLWDGFRGRFQKASLALADNLVYAGFAFLTAGLLFGALWAKEAWGHYWTWDPKETWALLTWLGYLAYIHIRHHHAQWHRGQLWFLALAFGVLLICWFGINYLPAAQTSVHVYSNT